MKVHLLSDVHTEFFRSGSGNIKDRLLLPLVRPADVLVLAGDIGTGRHNVLQVLNFFSQHYANVIYVLGNHEFYADKLTLNAYDQDEFVKKLPPNVNYMNPGVQIIGDVTFIGGTLFTNFHENPIIEHAALRGINDFRRANGITVQAYKDLYYQHSQYFKLMYENRTTEKVVFVSHFLPDVSLAHPRWKDDVGSNLLNHYYGGDLGNWIASLDNATWMFGHTHDARDELIGSTRCLAAPVGYPGENRNYEHLIHEV